MVNMCYKNQLISVLVGLVLFFCVNASHSKSDITIPIKAPVDNATIKLFAFKALMAVYDYDYRDLLASQKQAATLFTGKGWVAFQQALIDSKILASIKSNQYNLSATPLKPAKIKEQGLKFGRYYWQVSYPAMVIYRNNNYQQVQYLDLNITVVFKDKLRVEQLIAKKTKPVNCQKDSDNIKVSN